MLAVDLIFAVFEFSFDILFFVCLVFVGDFFFFFGG